jgi:hypothetical protein
VVELCYTTIYIVIFLTSRTNRIVHESFYVTVYLENGRRWTNYPLLETGTSVLVFGRIFGITKRNAGLAILAVGMSRSPGV